MSESTFRSSSPQQTTFNVVDSEPHVPSNTGTAHDEQDLQPIEEREQHKGDILLESLGINDDVNNMPSEDQQKLKESKGYILEIIKERGLIDNASSFKRVLEDVKSEMGLDENSSPDVVLDRIYGVVKAWKNLSFVRNSREKKSLFSKLMRANDSSEMNRIVFEEMEKKSVWQ